MRNPNKQISEIRNQVFEFEKELNDRVEQFIKETGIPVLLNITSPPSQSVLGKPPTQRIKVGVLIGYD